MVRLTVVAVGTTHPLALAGLALDLRVAHRLGIRVAAVVAGVSAQDAHGVRARHAVDDATIAAQFAALAEAGVAAFHVGALLDAGSVAAVARGLAAYPAVPVVWDPVLAASAAPGEPARLAADGVRAATLAHLLPRAAVVTPNRAEAAALLERGDDDAGSLAQALVARGAAAALVTGGDAPGDDVHDVLARPGVPLRHFAARRVEAALRGTGDLLALALAAELARATPLVDAIVVAQRFVRDEIAAGEAFAGTRVAGWD